MELAPCLWQFFQFLSDMTKGADLWYTVII